MAQSGKLFPSEQQVRLIMWSVPRSGSTALTKCLSFLEDSQVFFEPYVTAYSYTMSLQNVQFQDRAEAIQKHLSEITCTSAGLSVSQFSYKWIKEQLEEDHSDKKIIFCKDMAYGITENRQFIPKGYRHLFLIRHPLKVFPSWKTVLQALLGAPRDSFQLTPSAVPPSLLPAGYGFKEISELVDHVKEAYGQDPIIIDADDLHQDPKGILSALFQAIGLPFDEKILQWKAGDSITEQWVVAKEMLQWNQIGQLHKGAFDSTCFKKPGPLPDRSSLSSDILHCVDASMPYYERLFAQRSMPN